MKYAILALALSVFWVPQEVHQTRANYLACKSYDTWRAQTEIRSQSFERWYDVARKYLDSEQCWLTREGTPVKVWRSGRDPTAYRIRRPNVENDALWWIGRDAIQ